MERVEQKTKKLYQPYAVMIAINLLFLVAAFVLDSPADIAKGMSRIVTSRSVLITDYISVGGIGATFVNSAVVGLLGIFILIKTGVKPNGSIIMALFLSNGFAMFGKNIFNMWPLMLGVWLYSKKQKEPFINYSLVALLSATLSPIVSGFGFHPDLPRPLGIAVGILMGILAGFIFPPLSAFTVRVHGGYNLYNMGFAGGLISTIAVSLTESVGVSMDRSLDWSYGNNLPLAVVLYILSAGLILLGLFSGKKFTLPGYSRILKHIGRTVTDYYVMYDQSAYFNMGLLCALGTTLMLILKADLNGATICGILTMAGFGAFGKHLLNTLPLLIGAVISTYVNKWDPTAPVNTLAILFSTGLAPIAGQFGHIWGIVAGYIHVNLVMHIGFLNSGLNLYNNGYAAGFVAMLLVPVITAFQKERGVKHEAISGKKSAHHQ